MCFKIIMTSSSFYPLPPDAFYKPMTLGEPDFVVELSEYRYYIIIYIIYLSYKYL